MKRLSSLFALVVITIIVGSSLYAQVNFKQSMKQTAPDELAIIFAGTISSGWHIYSPNEKNGPTPTSFNLDKIEGAKLVGGLKANKAPIHKYEDAFGAEVEYYEGSVTFTQKLKLTGGKYNVEGYMEYGACNDHACMPPSDVEFKYSGETLKVEDEAKADEDKKEEIEDVFSTDSIHADSIAVIASDSITVSDLWKPVINELNAFDNKDQKSDTSIWRIFLLGILGGFIALMTPCVWPIIPMTVSFFLKRASKEKKATNNAATNINAPTEAVGSKNILTDVNGGKDEGKSDGIHKKKRSLERSAKGIRDAIVYGISIIVIYLVLGLAVTGIFGASALNALSTNAIFNVFFFLMLLAFGASFLGGFDITLPSSWNNAVDKKASSTSGMLSIFLMAFTLALVSFSCTGPIIGFLLVEMGTSGNIIGPAVGMFGFALALALPFTLFAIFPTWLKSVPKSGNWMNNVKVILGFIELAFSLKFLSVADLAYGWHILDREVFLSLWIILFFLLGCYLIGWIRFPHDEDEYDEMGEKVVCHRTSVTKFFLAVCSFAFAIYMIPGLWGAPCKAVSAFAPPMNTQDFNLFESEAVDAKYKEYEEGMAAAKKVGKPVMIDFTGFGCVNCRKMETAVWTDETIKKIITDDYVLIQLYVDDKTPLQEPVEVTENGQSRKLRTVGDKWSYFQRTKFGANTQPFYVLLDNQGKPLNSSYSYNEDIDNYIQFLQIGLHNYIK